MAVRRVFSWTFLSVLWLSSSSCDEQEPCNEGPFGSAYPVEGCCDPGAQKSASGLQSGSTDECECPGTGQTIFGVALCNARGNGFDCTRCPPPFAPGGSCATEGQINCPFTFAEDAARNGYREGMPVLHCVGGSWRQVFTCSADFCSDTGASDFSVRCGLEMAVEGAACDGRTGRVCDFDQRKVMRCSNGKWSEAELCADTQKCREGIEGVLCR
jgi:hypothetical protein